MSNYQLIAIDVLLLVCEGASHAERSSPAACATTDHFPKDQAMDALTQVAPLRQPVKEAVYKYWLAKRKRRGKPLLRRLQAPTASNDSNPHNVFRWGCCVHHALPCCLGCRAPFGQRTVQALAWSANVACMLFRQGHCEWSDCVFGAEAVEHASCLCTCS